MIEIKRYCFIPFVFYDTESYAAIYVLKQPIKIYCPIKAEIIHTDYSGALYVKFPDESVEAINSIKKLYSDYISENITRNSVMRVNELDCFETFEEAYIACKRLTNNFASR